MDKLTDFDDISDVSDAAIEWVLRASGDVSSAASDVRVWLTARDFDDATIIIAARLIQQHRPDLLVDPVDAAVRDWRIHWGIGDSITPMAKDLYQRGIEAGKKS